MDVRRALTTLVRLIADEAERNPQFKARVHAALEAHAHAKIEAAPNKPAGAVKRAKNRRSAAVLDPVQLARKGESTLRTELSRLGLDQLRDIVAEYGMDPGKLVLKWQTPERVIERIVEVSMNRAEKGSAFRQKFSTRTNHEEEK